MTENREYKLILIWPAIIALVFLLSPLLTNYRLWGINHPAFVNMPLYAVFVILTILCFIPQVSRGFNNFVANIQTGYKSSSGIKKTVISILIFICASALFYYLRSATQLLGDGYLRADELRWGAGYLPLSTEPLDTLLHFGFYKLTNLIFGINSHASYKIFSSLAGGFFLLILLNKLNPRINSLFSPLLVFPGLAGMQFYFGYVESYGLQYIGITLFLLYAYEYLKHGSGIHKLIFIFTLTFFIHFSTAYLMPAYIAVQFFLWRDKRLYSPLKYAGLLSLVLMIAGYIYFKLIYIPEFGRVSVEYLLAFTPNGYWILSSGHLLDILNNFLLSGMLMILLLPLIFKLKLWQNFNRAEKLFSSAVLIGISAYLLLLDPKLGFARDWDLFASTGLCVVVIAIFLLQRSIEKISSYRRLIQTSICLCIILTASFIAVNANRDTNTERFKNILQFYDSRSALGYETLAGQYRRHPRDESDLDSAIVYYHKAYELDHKTRQLSFIAGIYLDRCLNNQNPEKKSEYLQNVEDYSYKIIEQEDSSTQAYDYLIAVSTLRSDLQSALMFSDSMLKYGDEEKKLNIYFNRGIMYLKSGQPDSAEIQFNRVLELDSNYARAYGYLGKIYLDRGDKNRAIDYYLKVLELDPDNELRPQIEEILRKLR